MSASEALMTPIQAATENPRLEFRDGQYLFALTNLEGGICERFISHAAVREAFSGIPIDSGWIRPEIVRWGDGRQGEWAVAFIPPGVHELEITRELTAADRERDQAAGRMATDQAGVLERLNVPLPGLVWFGLGTQYYVWAVKTPKLEPYQEIFRCPLPNVYVDGKICWGMVRPPRMTARTLFDAWDLFIKSTFNNHLASGKSKAQRDDVRVVLRERANMHGDATVPTHFPPLAPYPVEDLVRQVAQVGVTLDAGIRQLLETGEMPA